MFQTPRLAAGYYSNLVSLCALRALRGDISLLSVLCPVEYSHGRSASVALVTLFHRGESSSIQSSPFLQAFRPLRELSFLRFPKPKFNKKFQICLVSFLPSASFRQRRISRRLSLLPPAFCFLPAAICLLLSPSSLHPLFHYLFGQNWEL